MGDRSTKPSSSMISRLRRDRFRCRLSSGISSQTSSGPLYPVFTGAMPGAVTQPVYFANMARLDRRPSRMVAESVGMARASPSRPAWLETALFTAPAGNSPLS